MNVCRIPDLINCLSERKRGTYFENLTQRIVLIYFELKLIMTESLPIVKKLLSATVVNYTMWSTNGVVVKML